MSSRDPGALFREGYALVVGVGEYDDPRWNAPTATRDAQALHATLTDPAYGAYPPGQAELLLGEAASSAGLAAALARLAERAEPDSVALVAFTGHGALSERDLYHLATRDTRFRDERIVHGSGFSIGDLARALREVRTRRLLLIINACFAGYAGQSAVVELEQRHGAVLPPDQGEDLLISGAGRAILTASRADQRSYFLVDSELSIFGQALVDALRGAGVPEAGGYVGLFELYNALYRRVRRAAERISVVQEPVLTLVEGVGPFPLARYPGAAGAGDPSALAERPDPTAAAGVRQIVFNVGAINIKDIQNNLEGSFGTVNIGDTARGNIAKHTVNTSALVLPPRGDAPADPAPPGEVSIGDLAGRALEAALRLAGAQAPGEAGGQGEGQGAAGRPRQPRDDGPRSVFHIEEGAQIGSVSIGNVALGDMVVTGSGQAEARGAKDPPAALPRLAEQLASARNVDPDAREDAAQKLRQASRAYGEGDLERARRRLDEALALMRAMGNPYVDSLARKVAAAREALG